MKWYEKIKCFDMSNGIMNILGDLKYHYGTDDGESAVFTMFQPLRNARIDDFVGNNDSLQDYIMSVVVKFKSNNEVKRLLYRLTKEGLILNCFEIPLSLYDEMENNDEC